MSLEDLSYEARDELALLARQLAENPKTRKAFLRLTKEAKPDMPIPELEIEDSTNYAVQKANDRVAHLEARIQQKDVKDWNNELTLEEKNVIGNILKGFTQTETVVNDYWSTYVTKWFPVPEIKMMASTFGAFETIHAVAYSYLNDTLGLTDF